MQELKELRRAGIRTFADAELYEADKKRKSTLQPSGPNLAPGSLPRDWQYPGAIPADQVPTLKNRADVDSKLTAYLQRNWYHRAVVQ